MRGNLGMTPEETRRRIAAAYAGGQGVSKICRDWGVTVAAIRYCVLEQRVPLRAEESIDDNPSRFFWQDEAEMMRPHRRRKTDRALTLSEMRTAAVEAEVADRTPRPVLGIWAAERQAVLDKVREVCRG